MQEIARAASFSHQFGKMYVRSQRIIYFRSAAAGAPSAEGNPAGYTWSVDSTEHVVYRGNDGHIHERDLTMDPPYNTYTRDGLPPTPIALPGRASLLAVVRPTATGDLYFVATGDGQGGHHFSATLAEHDQAVRRYVQKLRSAAARP